MGVTIQCDREINARKPDIAVVNKNERSCVIIGMAIPGDIKLGKERRKKLRDTRS